jgi:hypothetical protein
MLHSPHSSTPRFTDCVIVLDEHSTLLQGLGRFGFKPLFDLTMLAYIPARTDALGF